MRKSIVTINCLQQKPSLKVQAMYILYFFLILINYIITFQFYALVQSKLCCAYKLIRV